LVKNSRLVLIPAPAALAMREMYLTEPPEFDRVLHTLRDLEKRINDGL
jgi:hypothetical protein